MHNHLKLVREFHDQFNITQAGHLDFSPLSEIDIILRLGLLMQCGSETCKALADGDNEKVLNGLLDLAYNALAAIACQGGELQKTSVNWRQDGSKLSLVSNLSEKIRNCSSGDLTAYSALYRLCEQLSLKYINADFDLAIGLLHKHLMSHAKGHTTDQHLPLTVDLSSALFK